MVEVEPFLVVDWEEDKGVVEQEETQGKVYRLPVMVLHETEDMVWVAGQEEDGVPHHVDGPQVGVALVTT